MTESARWLHSRRTTISLALPALLFAAGASQSLSGGLTIHVEDLAEPPALCSGDPVPHPPIAVLGDGGFALPTSGVVSGSGTAADPYVICGWDIAPQGVDGILLKDTTAHVVIRGNFIHDSHAEVKAFVWQEGETIVDKRIHAGIYLYNADNVAIEDNVVRNIRGTVSATLCSVEFEGCFLLHGSDGIAVEFSSNVAIRDNVVTGSSAMGMRLRESSFVRVEGNAASANWESGITVWRIPGIEIDGNIVAANGGPTAVRIGFSSDAVVSANEIGGSSFNLALVQSAHNAVVTGNYLHDSYVGVSVTWSSGVQIHDNNIVRHSGYGVFTYSTMPVVDATLNWWGCPEGPGNLGCDSVSGNVLYDPWLGAPAF